jgi:hypothetical protein
MKSRVVAILLLVLSFFSGAAAATTTRPNILVIDQGRGNYSAFWDERHRNTKYRPSISPRGDV